MVAMIPHWIAALNRVAICTILILVTYSYDHSTAAVAAREHKKTKLVFYMHDIVLTTNATTVLVAGPNGNTTVSPSGSFFGYVTVIDDAVTQGPERTSKLLARAQGLYVSDSMNYFSLLLTFTLVFEPDQYNGTLSFHGADRVQLPVREVAVVGGTGYFRLGKGYALIETASLTGASAVLKFTCFVHH